jgi:hypothetical protein
MKMKLCKLLIASGATLLWPGAALSDVIFSGAGDIAVCGSPNDEQTASILDGLPGTVFTLGDNVYEDGTAQEFATCYGPSWGRHKTRTRPSIGNHEYQTPNAQPYLDYFGVARSYSFNLGDWHIVSLDSNCELPGNGGCDAASPTMQWLKADLAQKSRPCTLVYFHHPRWSSNSQDNGYAKMAAAWKIMYDANVDLVVAAHAHSYERFAPLDPARNINWARGIRSFVVGTGGARLKPFAGGSRGSQVRNGTTHGVLKLTLRETGYNWLFIPVAGKTFTDSGWDNCH